MDVLRALKHTNITFEKDTYILITPLLDVGLGDGHVNGRGRKVVCN